jgi:hypothetical protein
MSDNLFNYTFNVNTESSQNATLDVVNKGREVSPTVDSCFFTDIHELSQSENDGFGPIDASRFRVTSKFTTLNKRKAYAVTDGHLFIAPYENDSSKINIILKPLKPLYVGVKIKFLVYRGVNKNSFYKTDASNIDKIISKDDVDATPLITRLWDDFNEFNSSNPDEIFKANYIGIDSNTPEEDKIIKKYYKKGEYNLPKVKKDEHIGFFENSFGFEVIVDYGDYSHQKNESGFELDFNFLKAKECIFNIDGNNSGDIAGNRPSSGANMVDEKIFRENIYQFIDPAAFYGAHISKNDFENKNRKENSISCYNNNAFQKWTKHSQVYNNIIDRFITKNTFYLYVISNRGRSLDFYNPTGSNNDHGGENNFLKSLSWPIKIFSSASQNLSFTNTHFDKPNNQTIPENTIYYEINFNLKSDATSKTGIYINDCFNKRILNEITNQQQINVKIDKPAFINNIVGGIVNIDTSAGRLVISNFIYAFYGIKSNTDSTYNDLFGLIDLDKIYEPNDFENASNVIETIVYKKPKYVFSNNETTINAMFTLFDESNSNSESQTRLYVVYPVDSNSQVFVKSRETVANYTIDDDINKLFNINNIALGDGLRFWKNQKTISSNNIKYLTISGIGNDYQNLEKSYMIGITKSQYNSLLSSNADAKYNVFFHLQNVEIVDGIYKAELGIKYEDNTGLLHTQFPSDAIFVYSSNGKLFTTDEFVTNFKFSSELAKVTMDFLPQANWKGVPDGIGKYGIDWMRMEPLNPPTNIYPPFKDSTGLMNGQTEPNQYHGPGISFQQNPEMYNRLKNEIYGSIPIPWGTAPNDEYFTTWIRLNKTDEVELKLKINVNTTPQELKIKYEGNFYEIKIFNGTTQVGFDRVLPNNIKEYILPNPLLTPGIIDNLTLKIKRINLTNNSSANEINRKIEVFASELVNGQIKENIAGMLKLYQEPDVPLKVQFVKVKSKHPNIVEPKVNSDAFLNRQKDYLRKYLKQAGIEAKFPQGDYPVIDLANRPDTNLPDPNFQGGGHYMVNVGSTYYIRGYYELNNPDDSSNMPDGYVSIKKYLKGLLPAPLNENTMIVYFINGDAKKQNADTNAILPPGLGLLGGFSNGNNTDTITFLNENYAEDTDTVSHEVLHSLGLGHTFDNRQRFVFEAKKTDNIMDYTHLDHLSVKVKPSIYYWQWLIARQNATLWKRKQTEG